MELATDQRGVHAESACATLGSLAGFAGQMGDRRGGPGARMVAVTGKDGRSFFSGGAFDGPLLEDRFSVWSLAAGMAERLDARDVPDVPEIVRHVAAMVGASEFGLPRIPEGHGFPGTPLEHVRAHWPEAEAILARHCAPGLWATAFGPAIQEVVEMARDVLAPSIALRIAMEGAVPMAKLDSPEVGVTG